MTPDEQLIDAVLSEATTGGGWLGAVAILDLVEPHVSVGPDTIRKRLARMVERGLVERRIAPAVKGVHSGRPEYRKARVALEAGA